MKIVKKIIFVGLCLPLFAVAKDSSHYSDKFTTTNSLRSGWSISADIGYGYLNSPEAFYPNNFNIIVPDDVHLNYNSDAKIGDMVWGIHIGYDFNVVSNLLFGCEFGYKSFGKSQNKFLLNGFGEDEIIRSVSFIRKYDQKAIDFLLTTHYYPWKNGLNFFGKIGAAYTKSNIDQNADSNIPLGDGGLSLGNFINPMLSGNNDIWRLEPEAAFGVGYTLPTHVDLHITYTYTASSDSEFLFLPEKAKVYSTNIIMAGVSYTF